VTWIITLAGICALIVLHEFGHFAAAKAVGMRVERFSLFFPPKLFGVRRGETEYMIGAIPAGGYVKITGMNPEEIAELEPEVAARAYYNQPVWKRVVVIAAGPAMNLLIAFLIFWALLATGSHRGDIALSNGTGAAVPTVSVKANSSVAALDADPAKRVLHLGDRITAVNGSPATPSRVVSVVTADRCPGAVMTKGCRAAAPVTLTVVHDNQAHRVVVYPVYDPATKRMRIGYAFGYTVTPASAGPVRSAGLAAAVMWHMTTQTLTGIGKAFTSAKERSQLHSIVGITVVTQQAVASGLPWALAIIGFVSLALAIINLFPFLPLDGGHILWAVAEKVRGKRISALAMARFSSVGVVLLVFLVISGLSNDISQLTGPGIH
jgi:regulator of sigma E protease